ncbi:MAG TPA: beta-L-arabinofuranosidase domain-containing protein [Terracidiphilus sp.]|nr:beta-L-arabinofuranosidase domain-containing protein [Terracidiphilus sp.]
MSITRRSFLVGTTCAGTVAVAGGLSPLAASAFAPPPELAPYLSGIRMAATPASEYRAYRSKPVTNPETSTWVQVDLGQIVPLDKVLLYPASERMYPGHDQYYAGEGFPLRFRIDVSATPDFSSPTSIADFTTQDFPDPVDNITQYSANGIHARFVRLTATRLRPAKMAGKSQSPGSKRVQDSPNFTLTLAKIGIISQGTDIAVGCHVSADAQCGNPELLPQVTRPARQDGEEILHDYPNAVTDPSAWKRPVLKAQVPRTGVTLSGGLFETAMRNNIGYLLGSYTTDDLLRQFYERTGKITNFKPVGSQKFWEEDLAGSNAGRFLMGAGNTLRWIDDPELRRRLNVIVDGIYACREPNGYIMAYPPDTIFYSERAAYTRAWLTHGLLEAAYYGNQKALPMLRGYYDWFNQQSFLPQMSRGVIQGGQGMVANTRVALSPLGKPADAQVIQRYYQEDEWLRGLGRREPRQVWQYPYDRPHCYLLTDIEAYADMYLITGDPLYHDAALGAWELYRAHWQQAGGSISIIEFQVDPPDSNYLRQKLGELCGNSFWTFLSQRFHLLDPDQERYVAEIEKSIYNVALANQDGTYGLRYHTTLEGTKEKATRINTCCEGQGTRLIGSLPEHIYSLAEDGLYLNLYEPSSVRFSAGGRPMELAVATRFPFDPHVRATIKASAPTQASLRIRIPSWSVNAIEISVNRKVVGTGHPGTYFPLNRDWSNGDTIEFTLPAAARATRYLGADQIPGKSRYSFEYGPILLAAVGPDDPQKMEIAIEGEESGKEPGERLASLLEPIAGSPLHFAVRGNPGLQFMPYWQIQDQVFTCYPAARA